MKKDADLAVKEEMVTTNINPLTPYKLQANDMVQQGQGGAYELRDWCDTMTRFSLSPAKRPFTTCCERFDSTDSSEQKNVLPARRLIVAFLCIPGMVHK